MTTWDYTDHAATYSMRAPYAARAVDRLVALVATGRPRVADIGAGNGHLTIDLLDRGCAVDAVEPNQAMAEVGQGRTAHHADVRWLTGTAEDSGLPTAGYDLVTFGSSFNTTDRPSALCEAARLLRNGGHVACVWNHRRLDDPLQQAIELLIAQRVPGYAHGTRREDQAPIISASGLFGPARKLTEGFRYRTSTAEWVSAWSSHATLRRHAGGSFGTLVEDIGATTRAWAGDQIDVPYTTVGWYAERIPQ